LGGRSVGIELVSRGITTKEIWADEKKAGREGGSGLRLDGEYDNIVRILRGEITQGREGREFEDDYKPGFSDSGFPCKPNQRRKKVKDTGKREVKLGELTTRGAQVTGT